MPQRDHSTIRPGDEVVVTITGTVATRNTATGTLAVRTADGALALAPKSDDVHVAAVEPERPTLEGVLEEHRPLDFSDRGLYGGCICGTPPLRMAVTSQDIQNWERALIQHLADQLRKAGVAR